MDRIRPLSIRNRFVLCASSVQAVWRASRKELDNSMANDKASGWSAINLIRNNVRMFVCGGYVRLFFALFPSVMLVSNSLFANTSTFEGVYE